MDLLSLISTAAKVIKEVDEYSRSIKDAAKSFESLKAKMLSTRELLVQLEKLVKRERSETYHPAASPSQSTLLHPGKYNSTLQLIEDQGKLKELQITLCDISAWVNSLGSKPKMSLSRVLLRSSQAQERRLKQFSSELAEYKSTANLVLTMAIRCEDQQV